MPAIKIVDLNNAKVDVDHMAALATSPALTATDRFGTTKKTWSGIEQDLGAEYAMTVTGDNRIASQIARDEAEDYANAAASGMDLPTFGTVALGLAGTLSGGMFLVLAGGADNLARTTTFKNDAGVAKVVVDPVSGSEFDAIEPNVRALPVNYIRNVYENGDMLDAVTEWTYTGSATVDDVTGVPELAAIGLAKAYRVTPPGGAATASQIRATAAVRAALGNIAGKQLVMCSFVYSSSGANWPTLLSSYTLLVDATTVSGSTSGFIQVNGKLRMYWAKFNSVPAGTLNQVTIGFSSSTNNFNDAPGVTRYHGGLFFSVGDSVDAPKLATLFRYLGWDGQGPSTELFGTLETIVSDGSLGYQASTLHLAGDGLGESYIEVKRDGVVYRRSLQPYPQALLTTASVLNFSRDVVDGIECRTMTDDPAPVRAEGTTIGANHGYIMTSWISVAHGKTTADIGSVWTDGVNQHVLVGIVSTDRVYFTQRNGNGLTPAATLTHVSGGVNTGSITGTSSTEAQMYPPFQNRVVKCRVDDIEVTEHKIDLTFRNRVVFEEYYEVLQKAEIVAWIESQGAAGVLNPQGQAAFAMIQSYEFDLDANCTLYESVLGLKDGIQLQDIMFLQARGMNIGVDGPVRYYIPKTLPLLHEGVPYDFANIASADTTGWTTRLDILPSDCEPTGILADRVVQLTDTCGFAMGYLPVQDTDIAERRTNATVKAMQINNASAKVYLSAIDKGAITLNKGDCYSTIGYRNIFKRPTDRTSSYVVRTRGDDYFYADWHTTGIDRVPLPPDLAGRSFSVVEKSANVNVLSKSLTNSLMVEVTNAASYGYLILRVQP